jgi:hypothetical protein
MTTHKDFKRVVRGRMQKTGESYTAARSHLLKADGRKGGRAVATPSPSIDFATLAGMSDAKVKASTGCTWERWVQALDYVKAHEWPHREIAQYVHEKFKVPSWWTQTVTVGYERIKGLRAKGQRRDGGFEVNKSKTFAMPLARLYRGFSDKRNRAKWLPGLDLTIRTATTNKSMRITMPDGSSVQALFQSKGKGKSVVYVQHANLPDQGGADKAKEFWGERLTALAEVLA